MIDDRTKMLVETIRKLKDRGARQNIQKIFVKTHTADIAAILESFSKSEALELFKMEPSFERRAHILSYLNKDLQLWFLNELSKEEVTQLLSLMDPDDAADVLGHLPEDIAKEYLESMKHKDSEEVADLLGYPEDSAGGLMSSDYLALHQDMTVKEAIEELQKEESENKVAFYIYVINDSGQLVGVLSLKQLLLSRPTDRLKEIMVSSVISVTLDTDQETVAKTVERYDFLSLPVVDDTNKLMGVITVDDVIDVIREEAKEDLLAMGQAGSDDDLTFWSSFKARLPWLALAFLSGSMCFLIVYFYGSLHLPAVKTLPSLWVVAAFIPLMLSIGTVAGTQSATVVIGLLRSGAFEQKDRLKFFLRKEFLLSFTFTLLFGVAVLLLGVAFFPQYDLIVTFSLSIALQIFVAMVLGVFFPLVVQRLNMDPTVAPIPLFTALSSITAISILFGLYHAF